MLVGGEIVSFKMVLLPPDYHDNWPKQIKEVAPGAEVEIFPDPEHAARAIENADCAYGYLPPTLFERADKLRWIQCYAAAPDPSFYHNALVESEVTVTNFRGIYNDGVAHHALMLLLALSRDLHRYIPQQLRRNWKPAEAVRHLPDSILLVIGVGGIGSELIRLGKHLGMTTIGLDPRVQEKPEGLDELYQPEKLDEVLPRADYVVITTPDTPQTRGMIYAERLTRMQPTAFLINVGRGMCVVLEDLVEALCSGTIAGAALDVFEVEPLPADHPLWEAPNVLLTPHVAAHNASYLLERRNAVFLQNCQRFARGEPLLNVVDKRNRF